MGNAVFPTLPGLTWNVIRSPNHRTTIRSSISGRETRVAHMTAPLWKYTLAFEVLRQDGLFAELNSIVGFFNARQGRFDAFLFNDPADNTVVGHGFGVGDGVTTQFQLQRSTAGPRILDWQGMQPFSSVVRKNLVIHTEDFTDAYWTKTTGGAGSAPVVTANQGIAPDGNLTADKVVFAAPGAGDASALGTSSITVLNATSYTGGFWLKAFAPGDVGKTLLIRHAGASSYTPFTLTSAWQRAQITETSAITSVDLEVVLRPSLGGSSGTVTALVFGADLTLYPGPYIPATGSSPVTVVPSYVPSLADAFEIVRDLNGAPSIYKDTVLQSSGYTVDAAGLVTFSSPPAAGVALTWSGSYFWRVRFDQDSADVTNFLYQLYELKQLTFVSVL